MANPHPNMTGLTPWTKDNPPRPHGRKNFGLSMIEHMNEMPDLSREAVQAIADDESEGICRRRAAERVLDTKDAWNVVEHTHAKPRADVNMNVSDVTHVRRSVIHDRISGN